jgi:hypothetical protein
LKINIAIDDRQLQKLIRRFPGALDNGVAHVAHRYEAEIIKATSEKGWRNIPASVAVQRQGFAQYMVHAPVKSEDGQPYPVFQELGTGNRAETWSGAPAPRGRIYPTRAKFLHFEWQGQEWFRRSVEGVPATHVWRDTLEAFKPRMGEFLVHGVQQKI